jgi:hypothetical protein
LHAPAVCGSLYPSGTRHRIPGEEHVELLAYIDPGAGSLFIQAVIATVLVVPFFLRTQIRRGLDRLRGRSPEPQVTSATSTAADDAAPPAQP